MNVGYIEISSDDYNFVISKNWCLDNHCYVKEVKFASGANEFLHRQIAKRMGLDLTNHIDHKDRNNKRTNLRAATRSQNMANAKKPINNTSGYKGISLDRNTGRYRAYIEVKGERKYLGTFDTAHDAYCDAALYYFREFARVE